MKIRKIYKINILCAALYLIIVLATPILAYFLDAINSYNILLRTILCFVFSVLMLFISVGNYKNGKSFFNKNIKSEIIKVLITFYYICIFISGILYIYESVTPYKANGAYIMVAASTMILNVVYRSIKQNEE